MIIESLKSLAVPIDSVRGLEKNPRKGDVDAVAQSLLRFGQRKPIVVRRQDQSIIAGNHTWKAAKQLGWTEIAAVYTDDDDQNAKAFAIADNRTSDLGTYDDAALIDLLSELKDLDVDLLKSTGWSASDLSNLIAKTYPVSFDIEDAFGSLPDGERADATQMTFTLTLSQSETVKMAINAAKSVKSDQKTENKNSNGNALAFIAEEWLNGRG